MRASVDVAVAKPRSVRSHSRRAPGEISDSDLVAFLVSQLPLSRSDGRGEVKPKFPQADLLDAFDQVVEPLITAITCLRSHELTLFHLVNAYAGSPSGGTTG